MSKPKITMQQRMKAAVKAAHAIGDATPDPELERARRLLAYHERIGYEITEKEMLALLDIE